MEEFRVSSITNCVIPNEDVVSIHHFFVVENTHGKFILNWSVINREELETKKFSSIATLKRLQLSCVKSDWLDDGGLVIIQEVVNGKSGTICEKIQQILAGTTNGQRVLIGLESNDLDREFYEAIKMDVKNPQLSCFCALSDFGLSASSPFASFSLDLE